LRRADGPDPLVALEKRVLQLATTVERQRNRLDKQGARLDAQAKRLGDQAKRLGDQASALSKLGRRVNELWIAYGRMENQVAALESRVESMSPEVRHGGHLPEHDQDEAVALIEDIRTEHRRIRERFQVVTRYEERVRRLEEALEPGPDRDQ
jgi:predicted  nucleic acid-binding Zn-ribbon protein